MNLIIQRALNVVLLACCISCSNQKGTNDTGSISRDSLKESNTWQFECQRDEIAPEHWVDSGKMYKGQPTYALSGGGKEYANGCWAKKVPVQSNYFYEFTTHYLAQNLDDPLRSALARVLWFDEHGKEVLVAEYPATLAAKTPEGWNTIQQVYQCPEKAVSARLELVYRWDSDGSVFFSDAEFKQVRPIEPEKVKLATVHYIPAKNSTTQENLGQFSKFLEEAGEKEADIVCLPEGITVVNTGMSYIDVAEPVPGPTTSYLGEIAKKYGMYIVAGIYERDGAVVYNTAVLIGRDGGLVGKYHKVCLPREEIQGGITPGEGFPVFETDFGKVGMMICWDVTFPEVARMLTLRGADIIMLPIWGGIPELAVARAIENQVYLVTSSYSTKEMKSAIFDKGGAILGEADGTEHVKVVEVDLSKRKMWPFLGDLKNRIVREMPPQRLSAGR